MACPAGAITLQVAARAHPVIDPLQCTLCSECLYICPNNVFDSPQRVAPVARLGDAYDAVIIGAGIGGLMTGTGLAKAGKKVLILEQLSFTGGKYTHLVSPEGYAINTAAWTCPGPNSRIGKLCRKLGAEIQWVTIHDIQSTGDHWVVLKDGRRFTCLDEAQKTLVGGAAGMANVYRWIADMYNPRVTYPDTMTAREYIQKFIPGNPVYEQYVETIITHCFASQTVDYFSAMETRRAIVDSIEQMADWGTAIGGVAAITGALEAAFRKYGGEIALHTRVSSIDILEGKARGVTLSNGRKIQADIVIHNAGIKRFIQLAGRENLPPVYLKRLESAIPANVAALVLCTNRPLLGADHSLLHTMGWERTLNCYAPTFFDPALAPQGRHILDVFWVMQPPYDLSAELELVLAQLHEVFLEFDPVVEKQIPMFFTGMWTAEMAHRIGQSGSDRLDPQTPCENLFLAGYDCIGYGMAGDIIPHGVERVLHLILGDDQYAPQDEKTGEKVRKWIKSQVFRVLALGQSLAG